MKNNLISEDIKRMRMIMGYNRSKTLNENFEIISEITGAGATPPDAVAGTGTANANSGQVTKKTYTVPPDLKNVKSFQDWLVSKGFGGELGPLGADGKYGKYTAAAFTKHKDDYLKKPLEDDEYSVPVDADANDVLKTPDATGNNTNQNTGIPQPEENDADDVLKGGA